MVQRVATVAFEGIEARAVDVQVQVAPGVPAFKLVGRQCQAWPPERTRSPGLDGVDRGVGVAVSSRHRCAAAAHISAN